LTPSQIRALRRNLKLLPEEFADQLGFAGDNRRITVWRWETGKRKPSEQTVMLMKRLRIMKRWFYLK
jgi:DNA-binding transcriptional regulator YiaG